MRNYLIDLEIVERVLTRVQRLDDSALLEQRGAIESLVERIKNTANSLTTTLSNCRKQTGQGGAQSLRLPVQTLADLSIEAVIQLTAFVSAVVAFYQSLACRRPLTESDEEVGKDLLTLSKQSIEILETLRKKGGEEKVSGSF